MSGVDSERLKISKFIEGHSEEIRQKMIIRDFGSLNEAVTLVDCIMRDQASNKQLVAVDHKRQSEPTEEVMFAGDRSDGSMYACEDGSAELDAIMDVYLTTQDVSIDTTIEEALEVLAVRVNRKFPETRNMISCFYCGRRGHGWMRCDVLFKRLEERGFRRRRTPPRSSRNIYPRERLNDYRSSTNYRDNSMSRQRPYQIHGYDNERELSPRFTESQSSPRYRFNRSNTPNRYERESSRERFVGDGTPSYGRDHSGDRTNQQEEFDRSNSPYRNPRNRRKRGQMSNVKYQLILGEDVERLRSDVEGHLLQRMDEQEDDMFDEDEIDSLALN